MAEQDVYQALSELGFEKYTEQLKEFMKNYTDKEDEAKKQLYKKRKEASSGLDNDVQMTNDLGSKSKRLRENADGLDGDEEC